MPRNGYVEVEHPQGKQTFFCERHENGTSLAHILQAEQLPLNTRCGQKGTCDGCMLELVSGSLADIATGELIEAQGRSVTVRACEYGLAPACELVCLRIPARSLLGHEPQALSDFKINIPWAHNPLVNDSQGDGASAAAMGVAIDVGTTTVALLLVDLASGNVVRQAADFNRQIHLGDDVLTRISLCATDPVMVNRLQTELVRQTLQPLLDEMLEQAGVDPGRIAAVTVAGNTTMLHLLCGVDPTPMGTAPFAPVFLDHRVISSDAIGLELDARAHADSSSGEGTDRGNPPIHLLPGAAAYLGADIIAGIVASGLAYEEGPSLLIDIGTNGEIVLKHGTRLVACATAAGPAFEGVRLASGMRAARGAISRLRFKCSPLAIRPSVIGDERPIGLCGSAYIDFLAEARRVGLINTTGRIQPQGLEGADRVVKHDERNGLAVVVAKGLGREPILVSECDLASLLQAKAAIAAGILTLLERCGLGPKDVEKVYLAGGFGRYVDAENAIRCGLLPNLAREKIHLVGNTSLAGAYLSLLDKSLIDEMSRIAKQVEVVELNQDPGFEMRYVEQLCLPPVR